MDWVKTALSVGTTIGKIAGMLQGNDSGLIHFGPTGSGVNPAIGQAVFFLDKTGQCWVGNQGETQLGISFPSGRGELPPPNTYVINPYTKYPITSAFNVYAQGEQDHFVITPLEVPSPSGARMSPHATVQAQAANVPAGVEFSLGPYITVKVNASDRTILVTILGGLALLGIVLLNINGAGDTVARLTNIGLPGDQNGGTKSMTVPIPAGVEVSRGLQFIDITVAIQDFETLLKDFPHENADLLEPLSEEDRQRILAYTEA